MPLEKWVVRYWLYPKLLFPQHLSSYSFMGCINDTEGLLRRTFNVAPASSS